MGTGQISSNWDTLPHGHRNFSGAYEMIYRVTQKYCNMQFYSNVLTKPNRFYPLIFRLKVYLNMYNLTLCSNMNRQKRYSIQTKFLSPKVQEGAISKTLSGRPLLVYN